MSYWFRANRHGGGAGPANWKGWLATAVFLVVIFAVDWELAGETWFVAFGIFLAVLALMVWIVWKKTEGPWRWRRGPDEKEK